MRLTLYEWMLLPFMLWVIFQGVLYYQATLIETAIHQVIYEGAKKAAIEGRFTVEIYDQMREQLQEKYKLNAEQIAITGTEQLTYRGEYMRVEITAPAPSLSFLPFFSLGDRNEATFWHYEKYIVSEYIYGDQT